MLVLWLLLFILLVSSGIVFSILVFIHSSKIRIFNKWIGFLNGFRELVVGLLLLLGCVNLYLAGECLFIKNELWVEIIHYCCERYKFLVYVDQILQICINEVSLIFSVLVGVLYPVVVILIQYDLPATRYKYYTCLIWLYCVIYVFIFTSNLIVFYISYEFMICLIFYILHLTANNRGSIEATMFFLAWACLGSILVGAGFLYLYALCGSITFVEIQQFSFLENERFYLYCLLFFGFGTKLAVWPAWYWLPRAHVEVSSSFSVFLSCILLKVCFYGLIRSHLLVGGESFNLPFFIVASIAIFDVTIRLVSQIDLKAIIAYGSVLHVNLLIILFLLDTTKISNGLIWYIWGHSWGTAGLFFVVHLIERRCNSRLTTELSGLFHIYPLIALFGCWVLISFLGFPLQFFFWGECWLWVQLLDLIPITAFILMLFSIVIYMLIFFWIWWGFLFGGPTLYGKFVMQPIGFIDFYLVVYLIYAQYIIGMQPLLLCWGTLG